MDRCWHCGSKIGIWDKIKALPAHLHSGILGSSTAVMPGLVVSLLSFPFSWDSSGSEKRLIRAGILVMTCFFPVLALPTFPCHNLGAVWWEQDIRGGVGTALSDPGVALSCVCPGQKLPMSGELFLGFTKELNTFHI